MEKNDELLDFVWKSSRLTEDQLIFLLCSYYANLFNTSVDDAYLYMEKIGFIERSGDYYEQKR